MPGTVDGVSRLLIIFAVAGIKPVIPCHLVVFFRDVLYEQGNEIKCGDGPAYKNIVLVPVIVESNVLAIIGIDAL